MSIGSALWGAVPPVAVHSQQVVHSAGHPKLFYRLYWVLLHDRQLLAGLSIFVVAGSGEA